MLNSALKMILKDEAVDNFTKQWLTEVWNTASFNIDLKIQTHGTV